MRGVWVRKYFVTKAEAKTYCDQRNIEARNQGREAGEFPSWLRVMAQRANGHLAPYGKTIDDSVAFYLLHLGELNRSTSLTQLVDELIENRKSAGLTDLYCYDIGSRLGRSCREFSNRSTAEIDTQQLDEWLAGLNLAPATRNTFRRDLHTLFKFWVSRGYSSTNPVEKTRIAKVISQPVGILTVDQTVNLLNSGPEKLIPYLAIGAFAGLRASEIVRLDWREIDLESGFI